MVFLFIPTRLDDWHVQVRWGASVKQLKEQASMLPGDVLLVASFISYVGCFTKQYRVGVILHADMTVAQVDLLEKNWIGHVGTMNPKIPMSLGS